MLSKYGFKLVGLLGQRGQRFIQELEQPEWESNLYRINMPFRPGQGLLA